MKSIKTLVQDIYDLFRKPAPHDESLFEDFGKRLGKQLYRRLSGGIWAPKLRMSNLGTPCNRRLWYSINKPHLAEELPPDAKIKFFFGDILEEMLLFFAQLAGHTVTGQQDNVSIEGVNGRRDGIIDGRLVDCKSASNRSFIKHEQHGLKGDDPFGYLPQLNSYLTASLDDPLLLEKDKASFLVINKELGKIVLDTYRRDKVDYPALIQQKKEMLAQAEPPERDFTDVPDGKSGNKKLGTYCSYCPFKFHCWPSLRVFNYAGKPSFLTVVERLPKVQELTPRGTQAPA